MAKNKKGESKYFYAIVLITLAIGGFIVWELFFSGAVYERTTDPSLERTPEVDLLFLDSHYFGSLTEFNRGDDPLLPWQEESKSNPFRAMRVPEDRNVRDWWGVFNLGFRVEEDGLIATEPSLVEGAEVPELILFDGRSYEISLIGDANAIFEITADTGRVILENEMDDTFVFQADSEMNSYRVENYSGDITVTAQEGNGDREEVDRRDLLFSARRGLSSFYNEIRGSSSELSPEEEEDADLVHAELESELRRIEDLALQNQVEDEELAELVSDFLTEVENEQELLVQKIDEGE